MVLFKRGAHQWEHFDGFLVIGDEQGQLHFSGEAHPTGIQDEIKEIIPITSYHSLVKFSNSPSIIFDFESKTPLEGIQFQKDALVLGNGSIAYVNENTIIIQNYDPIEKKVQKTSHELNEVLKIRLLSNMIFLILHTDKESLTLWDAESISSISLKNSDLWKTCLSKKNILLDNETLVIPGSNSPSFYYRNELIDTPNPGGWGVDDMILLSDGSVMYGTNPRGSGIYVVRRDKTISFSMPTENRKIDSLKELVDGSVAVKFSDSILILKPNFDDPENTNYKIDKLRLKLQHNPSKLDLYDELAQLYESKNESSYNVYLWGLEAAAKCNNLYKARRFYARARNIQPESQEPIRNFLLYLKKSSHEKIKRQLMLDLYALTRNKDDIHTLKNRGYKKRLFIGEGDFSFTEAFIEKHENSHPEICRSITATELLAPAKDKEVVDRIASLQQKKVTIFFDVDARNIHRVFKGRRFERIHWNCPFGEADSKSREQFPQVMPKFFQSCSHLQLLGDRIHVTLVQENSNEPNGYWTTRQQENPLVLASASTNYRLIRKRRLEGNRYPKYHHVKTGKSQSYTGGDIKREFVFEKVTGMLNQNSLESIEILKDPTKKEYKVDTNKISPNLTDYYFVCSSDEDSSDCYDSE